ncbi:putative iron-regulated membrane protein [Variovorax boronicumulans]|uniref:PepSY-associated TM helix domain-containing protein n=1 Tax=Variovorax boronicumulans TaxID=436515 RepID=UPI00277DCE3B|nr:PepSY-associated TM helix domain-containing protein [Variovorax boronicumulans]MDP9995667.1 putative iron-regulated membrane protein [Variovorax boronicumulans]MDQ0006868.1 putative iron-regulated membrane protein [Variovorax boronicumulans]MDQ0036790.1 putative iron-regulated membrane protein [Variovorax boronicumulans]MDQ0044533.1 putative iron-regulated membrane protein [Variovorax boronicumulans]
MPRQLLLRLHRWAGLATGVFLVLAGLTGSLLAFEDRLEAWLNSALFVAAPPTGSSQLLDPFALREMAQRAAPPQALVEAVLLDRHADRSLRYILSARTDPATGLPMPLDVDELFLNPYDGTVQGARRWGASLFQRETAVSFLYRLHYALALPAPWSARILGTVGLLWTFNCLIGLWLTLPRRSAQLSARGWWLRWRAAWRIGPRGNSTRTTLDLHRVTGLWLWLAMLVFAWSSVMFNLRESVYRPLMSVVAVTPDLWAGVPTRRAPMQGSILDWKPAHAAAREAMAALAAQKHFTVNMERDLRLDCAHGVYAYRVHSSLDVPGTPGMTTVLIDAATGAVHGFAGDASGHRLEQWLGALHMARAFGTSYKVLVSLFGLGVATLSLAGLLLWYRRTRHRSGR